MENAAINNSPDLWVKNFPRPRIDGNKYDRGYVIISGGDISEKTASSGAAKIAAKCALRAGAGLVAVTCNKETFPIYAASFQAIMVKSIETAKEFSALISDKKISSVSIGSGSGLSQQTKNKVIYALKHKKSLVIDADALTVFADEPERLFTEIKSPCILTPHAGEFNRLFGSFIDKNEQRIPQAQKAAALSNSVVILKGNNSVIASPCGKISVNYESSPYLASAGTGDALAGICAGLLAQSMPAFEAACAAVWLHSQTAIKIGAGLIAEDIEKHLPLAIKGILG